MDVSKWELTSIDPRLFMFIVSDSEKSMMTKDLADLGIYECWSKNIVLSLFREWTRILSLLNMQKETEVHLNIESNQHSWVSRRIHKVFLFRFPADEDNFLPQIIDVRKRNFLPTSSSSSLSLFRTPSFFLTYSPAIWLYLSFIIFLSNLFSLSIFSSRSFSLPFFFFFFYTVFVRFSFMYFSHKFINLPQILISSKIKNCLNFLKSFKYFFQLKILFKQCPSLFYPYFIRHVQKFPEQFLKLEYTI